MAKSKNPVNGVYAILCDGIVKYIGSGHDLNNSRESNHFSKMRHGKHTKKMQAFWNEINDESRFSFEVLEETLVKDTLTREKYYKELHKDTILNSNNINKTEKNIRRGWVAKRHKEKCSEVQSGENNPNCQNEVDDIIKIKCCIRDGMKNKDIAKFFNKRPEYISQIKIGYRWSEIEIPIGYEFKPEQKIETVSTAMEAISEQENIFHIGIIPQIEINQSSTELHI